MNLYKRYHLYMLNALIAFFLTVAFGSFSQAQQRFVRLDSTTHFDRYKQKEWVDKYDVVVNQDSSKFYVPYLSVRQAIATKVGFLWKNIKPAERSEIEFYLDTVQIRVSQKSLNGDTCVLTLPARDDSYVVFVKKKNGAIIAQLNVAVYWYHEVDVIVVPLVETALNERELSQYLNTVFEQAQLGIHLSIDKIFKDDDLDPEELFVNPSADFDRYTDQMHQLRDRYFEENPNASEEAYYVFIVPGFNNESINGYNVVNKSLSFVKNKKDATKMFRHIAQQLGASIGALGYTWGDAQPQKGTTKNLMDEGIGVRLIHEQWESIQRNCHAFSIYDDYEDVRTTGGLIAYYFWEENDKGEIIAKNGKLFSQIQMPFKRNHYSYYQNITNIFFKPLFTVFSYRVNTIHFIVFIVVCILVFMVRKRIFVKIKERPRWLKFGLNLIIFTLFVFFAFQTFLLVNRGYRLFEMKGGEVTEMEGASMNEMRLAIENGIKPEELSEKKLGSELFVKKNGKWQLKRRKNVLYFDQYKRNNQVYYRFVKDSDSLIVSTKDYAEKAESHYIVINYINDGEVEKQRVFNHLRVEITSKITLPNPKKRILLFVNGYRPTSNGNSFEATFDSIMKKGLEHANTNNLIYDHDRYNYWEIWNEMDKRFKSKINPGETFYADGHHSVSTSNHRSLVEFTSLSQNYPKRCKNPKRHVCQDVEGDMTYKSFNLESNKEGFAERRRNGRIAGRNLYQMLNEIPNLSFDDTLYIVAHSMGYAYSLGIIDELRGKINFGGFYIMAPENAEAGKVNMSEWKEIWQYGSDFDENKFKSPCLLDGIAPQTKAGGLNPSNRAFIPDELYKRKGFFDSHFVGYYTWIFNLKENEAGYIRQR